MGAEVLSVVVAEVQAAVGEMQAAVPGLQVQAAIATKVQCEQQRQLTLAAEVQAVVAGLDMQATVAAAVQNEQERQMAQLQHTLEQQQRQHLQFQDQHVDKQQRFKLRLEYVARKVETSEENLLREAFRINRICAAVGVPVGT